ncbi:Cell division ATPase FtsA [Hathewaya proteolytica DSM 3090]|uniref:Cell division ATPase FtsA n=1 Tax=Hathewaya proteolytica DSM 3090 TaxID=1121331 RepID=A0A1M6MGU9_9CLOT|nr:cell division FtsA domain-containing protein [Hathewaya proteolytica]SHJ82685.1 Cell division ATPase FtsA [Hathewaya proteolytica DSM 3090]
MDNLNNLIFSLDIGTRSIKGSILKNISGKLHVIAEHYIEHEERAMVDGQIHDIGSVASTVSSIKANLESQIGEKLTNVAIAAAGRFLKTICITSTEDIAEDSEIDTHIINALELSAVQKAEEEINKTSAKKGVKPNNDTKLYCVGYTVKSYYLNGYAINNLLSHKGKNAGVEIIATFLPSSVVDSLYSVMKMVNLKVSTLTLEPIAAMEAVIPSNLRLLNIALVDVGAGTSDIAISNKNTVVGYGMVPLAGDEVTETIAENYLIDFNTADKLKKDLIKNDTVTYTDVLGFEYTIDSKEVLSLIEPIVEQISREISEEILKLNSDKSPSAVFIVGGGAHTPLLMQKLAKKLELPEQRIGIKGREAVKECVVSDYTLGSTGITVLGIGLIAASRSQENYIEVNLNNTHLTLFNLSTTKISDVLVQASVNPKLLIGKTGRDLVFSLNGSPCKALGGSPTEAKVYLNGKEASLESSVENGDNIEISYAKNGENACPRIYEYIPASYDIINFTVDGVTFTLEPEITINSMKAEADAIIRKNDDVEIIFDPTLDAFIKHHNSIFKNKNFYISSEKLSLNYCIKPGDNIITKPSPSKQVAASISNKNLSSEKNYNINVSVNKKSVTLTGKSSYVFTDIFDFIDFDRSSAKGNLSLIHNGKTASYLTKLSEGDTIEISWK